MNCPQARDVDTSDMMERQLAVRYHWAQGRYAEQCRRDAQAAMHFAACLDICTGRQLPGTSPHADLALSELAGPRETSAPDDEVPPLDGTEAVKEAPASEAVLPVSPPPLPPLCVCLVNCKHDAVISAETAAARRKTSDLLGMVENGQQLLQQGRQAEVVRALAAAVLRRQTETAGFDKRTHLRALTLLKVILSTKLVVIGGDADTFVASAVFSLLQAKS